MSGGYYAYIMSSKPGVLYIGSTIPKTPRWSITRVGPREILPRSLRSGLRLTQRPEFTLSEAEGLRMTEGAKQR